jgi:cyclic pyranopterin phosphate synthase
MVVDATARSPRLLDRLRRPLRDLRISLTDRCNFRCRYCMPREVFGPGYAFMPTASLLQIDEIERLVRLFVRLGVDKIRLTGGEPLLRRGLEDLVARLSPIDGIDDLALTTNGYLLTEARARALRAAGLGRVTVSLDALDDPTFMTMNDSKVPVARILAAIDGARAAGLAPVKINTVVKRGVNEHAVTELATYFRGTGHIVRYIEYMDVGNTNGWRLQDVVPAAEILARIGELYPLEAVGGNRPGEVARRYRYADGDGEIGVIASVTQPFCQTCSRARLSADGRLFACLFAADGVDLRTPLRDGASDEDLLGLLETAWRARRDRYSMERTALTALPAPVRKVEMSAIGG